MTTRLKGFVVTLEEDFREDDIEHIRMAILALKHVVAVEPLAANSGDMVVRARAIYEVHEKLINLLRSLT